MYKEKQFNKLIKQICKENNIQFQELSDDWIIKLKKGNTNKFLVGYKFDLNTQATSEICNDKFALYAVLNSENIPVIKHSILFKNEEIALDYIPKLDEIVEYEWRFNLSKGAKISKVSDVEKNKLMNYMVNLKST